MGHSTWLGHDLWRCQLLHPYICTVYYLWLWLLINIVVISYWRWRDWFHSNLKNNCECALIIKDNRWYIYGCNNWHRHKSCPNLVEWSMYMYAYCTVHTCIQMYTCNSVVGKMYMYMYAYCTVHTCIQMYTCNSVVGKMSMYMYAYCTVHTCIQMYTCNSVVGKMSMYMYMHMEVKITCIVLEIYRQTGMRGRRDLHMKSEINGLASIQSS